MLSCFETMPLQDTLDLVHHAGLALSRRGVGTVIVRVAVVTEAIVSIS